MSQSKQPYAVHVEPEALPARALSAILATGVAIVVISAIVVKLLLPVGRVVQSEVQGAPERIGRLEQSLILTTRETALRRAAQDARLDSYGWVDEKRQIIHIPVERAMQLVVEKQR